MPHSRTLARRIQPFVQSETANELGAKRLFFRIVLVLMDSIRATRATKLTKTVFDACETAVVGLRHPLRRLVRWRAWVRFTRNGMHAHEIEIVESHVVAVGRGPTKLEIEHHVSSGHAQHRTWCDACMRARGIAGRHERREPGREDEDPLVAEDDGLLEV